MNRDEAQQISNNVNKKELKELIQKIDAEIKSAASNGYYLIVIEVPDRLAAYLFRVYSKKKFDGYSTKSTRDPKVSELIIRWHWSE